MDGGRCIISEHTEQVRLFRIAGIWASQGIHPELELLHAIPMGGKRPISVAKRMKASGAKKGLLDMCLPVPRGGYHGLYLELKVKGGRLTKEQKWWIEKLREQGFRVEVCYGCQAALDVLMEYLGGDE